MAAPLASAAARNARANQSRHSHETATIDTDQTSRRVPALEGALETLHQTGPGLGTQAMAAAIPSPVIQVRENMLAGAVVCFLL